MELKTHLLISTTISSMEPLKCYPLNRLVAELYLKVFSRYTGDLRLLSHLLAITCPTGGDGGNNENRMET